MPVIDMCDTGLNTRIQIFWIQMYQARNGLYEHSKPEPLF